MALPPSKIDATDYPSGPNGMARLCEDRIAELEALKAACRTGTERSPINKQLFALRGWLQWCKSRAGYVETLGTIA